jgi:type IV pilus assembly PilX-like protein
VTKLAGENGIALVLALMTMTMMMALGTALILTTNTELRITRNFAAASEAMYAADAALERAIIDIEAIHDWNALLDGSVRSTFVDGRPVGVRMLADGKTISLDEALNVANCQRPMPCSDEDMSKVTSERPWGANNPRWSPFAWGGLNSLTPNSVNSPFYVVVMVGDDPAECDNDPLLDGGPPVPPCVEDPLVNPGAGVISLRAEAFGPFGTHKVVEATVAHAMGNAGVRMLTWREAR